MADLGESALGRHRGGLREKRASGPVLRSDGATILVTTRAAVHEALDHPEVYSSRMRAGFLGNVRPPLELDPPDHRKFRRILDPLFAPKRVAELAEPVERLVNDLIDGFIDDREIDFARQFSVPLPSQVFLSLLGLPMAELPRFLN